MRVIYVAGPFRSPTHWGVVQNVRKAEAVALEIWKAGAAAICPHTNTANFEGAAPDEIWLAGDIEIMRRCDAVVMTEGWEKSKGATAEKEIAEGAQLPVFFHGNTESWNEFFNWLLEASIRRSREVER